MISVSVCMIVKNEEKVLERCLECLKSIADEIVITDTGSSDRTKEIAKRYTDRVFDLEWTDDFSAARNFAFLHCTKDYVYMADADEVIDGENAAKFIALKETLSEDTEIVQMKYKNQLEYNTTYNFDEELRPKLYKRVRSFVFEGRVHESVRLEPVVLDSDITIIHKPQSLHSKRDFSLFKKAVELDGGLDARLRGMYARELAVSGKDCDFVEAADYFKKAVEEEKDEDLLRAGLYILMRAARVEDDSLSFMKYSHRALALGACSESAYEIAVYYDKKGQTDEAGIWYCNAATQTEPLLNVKFGKEYPESRLKEIGG